MHLRLTRFYLPLALQAAAQSFTYPLVAMVASGGPGGPLNLAGLAQSNMMLFLLGTLGAGLITTGMVYGRDREGYNRFLRVNFLMAVIMLVAQALLCFPPLAHLVFGTIIGLPPSIESPARTAFLCAIPLNLIFCLRNPYQVLLLNGKASGRASLATICRILLTALLAPVFAAAGLVGPAWAVACLTIPVALETVVSRYFARPFLRALGPATSPVPSIREMFAFNIPLSLGGTFLALSGLLIGTFIARAASPERMLPVYYLTLGLTSPVSFAATRLQNVVLAFPPAGDRDRTNLRFTVFMGVLLGLLPLMAQLPFLADFYFTSLQKLDPADLPLVRRTAFFLVAVPLTVGLRAYTEGMAAWMRKPTTVLSGQAVYLGILATAGFVFLSLHLPGNLIGPLGLVAANLAAAAMIHFSLSWERQLRMPVPPTRLPEEEA
jgi:hypothetical protein